MYKHNDKFINWPTPATGWEDTGEGGQYAYLFVPANPDDLYYGDAIAIEQQDVVVGIVDGNGNYVATDELYPPYPEHVVPPINFGDNELLDYVHENFYSHPVAFAAYLGGSPFSLWSETEGRYFLVQYGNLNDKGKELFAAAQNLGEPYIMTLLDT